MAVILLGSGVAAAAVWLDPRVRSAALLLAALAQLVLAIGVIRSPRGPASFSIDRAGDRGFTVPARPWLAAWAPIWLFLVIAMAPWWPTYGGRYREEAFDPVVWAPYLLVVLILVPVWVRMVVIGRALVRLTPEGIERRDLLGMVSLPWASLHSGPSQFGDSFGQRLLQLPVGKDAAIHRRGLVRRPRDLPLQILDVNPGFLSDALEHYVHHPQYRSAIGTVEEHRRLYATLAQRHAGSPAHPSSSLH
jgi:hypothetical protein